MADPVVDPAPSPSAPVTDPAAVTPVTDSTVDKSAAPDPAKPVDPAAKLNPAAPVEVVVPEKYEFKAPDGMELDAPLLAAVDPVFKELKLTQEQATKLFDTYNKAISATEAKRETDFKEWMKTTVTNYQAALKKEWGAQHDANVVVAQRGMARVFSAEAKKLLDDTGLGSHPEFVKAFYQVGKMVSEDKPPNGAPTGARKGTAEVLYGQTN